MKALKIVIVSDNHGLMEPLKEIRALHSDAQFFFHLGDSEMPPKMLSGWAYVRGNNDYDPEFPMFRIVDTGSLKFYLTHGHRHIFGMELLAETARSCGCSVVCFGHTHVYADYMLNGVRFLNPGSLRYNRDGSAPSYMVVTVDEEGLHVQRMRYEPRRRP